MSIGIAGRRDLERFRFWQGQMLRSRDFRDQSNVAARLRGWHNRALHNVPGVRFGLAVSLRQEQRRGIVTVECGLAYDCTGRELVLQQPREIELPETPAVGATLYLVLAYGRPAVQSCTAPVDVACCQPHSSALESDSELRWKEPMETGPADGVPLAAFTRGTAVWERDTTFVAVTARPAARPRLAAGETVRGNTPWELWTIDKPDPKGGLTAEVVGVQTHVDTSAEGFTETPVYFATLEGPAWDLKKTAFAPAFFPQVANPSVDGFTFRLLMVGIARRSYQPAFGTGRIVAMSRRADERLEVTLDDQSSFRRGDAVTLLRPRGETAAVIDSASSDVLTLHAALPGIDQDTKLALGNLPRAAAVVEVKREETMIVAAASTDGVNKGDVLYFAGDAKRGAAAAVVTGVSPTAFTLQQPIPGLAEGDKLRLAPGVGAITVASATLSADNTSVSVTLRQKNRVKKDDIVFRLPARRSPLSAPAKVTEAVDDSAVFKPPFDDGLAPKDRLTVVGDQEFVAGTVERQTISMAVKVSAEDAGRFRAGDVVARLDRPSAVTVVDQIKAATVSLQDVIDIEAGQVLVAANFTHAVTVQSATTTGNAMTIQTGRPDYVSRGVVARRVQDAGDLSAPVRVASSAAGSFALQGIIDGLQRFDTLAMGEFPATVKITAVDDSSHLRVAPDALRAGDVVALLDGDGVMPVTRVVTAGVGLVSIQPPLENASAGKQLAVLHFSDAAVVAAAPTAANPLKVKVDRRIEVRTGDIAAPLAYYIDNAATAVVSEEVTDNTLVLRAGPGSILAGDGMLAKDVIDGGIVGPAAFTPFQPSVRLESGEGLTFGSPVTVSGTDELSGQFASFPMAVSFIESTSHRIVLASPQFASYFFRPERMSLVADFNSNFPAAFVTFAQKQGLYVCWAGCQDENREPTNCAGTRDAESNPCAGSSSEDQPCH